MTQRFALVDAQGVTQNIIMWDGVSPYTPPDGLKALLEAQAPAYAPAAPAPPTTIPALAFWNRFTQAERSAIASNPALNVWVITALAAGNVDLLNAETKAGLDFVVAQGALTAAREAEVLTP